MGAMATQSPFPFSLPEPLLNGLASLADKVIDTIHAPQWLAHEAQQRLVLLINHVVMQEPQAMERLARQAGRTLMGRWRQFDLHLTITKAGLFDVMPGLDVNDTTATGSGPLAAAQSADLVITLRDTSLAPVLMAVTRGDKPSLTIEGDVQLAADVNWVVDHVRWDIEEDLSRILGDAPAHLLVRTVRSAWSKRPQ